MGSTPHIRGDVERILTDIDRLGAVTPAERAALRQAAARLSLVGIQPPRRFGPVEERPLWLSTAQVADVLRVSPESVRKLCAAGEFGMGAIQLGAKKGSPWRIRRAAVHAYIRRQIRGVA